MCLNACALVCDLEIAFEPRRYTSIREAHAAHINNNTGWISADANTHTGTDVDTDTQTQIQIQMQAHIQIPKRIQMQKKMKV